MNMKILLVMMALAPCATVMAQEEPIETELTTPRVFEPTVCADLRATPTTLPNGDFLYPTIPCKPVDYKTPPPPEPKPVAQPQPMAEPPLLDDLEQGTVPEQMAAPAAEERMDYNQLQMKRLGELDARQGKPINMNHGGDLYYLQGYTQGQKDRLNVPTGQRGFGGIRGGFGGY